MGKNSNFLTDKVRLFVFAIAVISISGGSLVYGKYQNQKIEFPRRDALEGKLTISSPTVLVSENEKTIHTANLTIHLKNNTDETLTGVKLIVANNDLSFLETPSATRFIHQLPLQNDPVFQLNDLPPKSSMYATVSAYAKNEGNYVIKTDVNTDQKVTATSSIINSVSLKAVDNF